MTEEWAAIPGFEGVYEISSLGRVRSLDRTTSSRWGTPVFRKGGLRKARVGDTGYMHLNLYRDGGFVTRKIHRLVAHAFCEKPAHCNQVNHKDGNKLNNASSNLEWVTAQANSRHAIENGLQIARRGEESSLSTLSNADIDPIRRLILSGLPISEIAERFKTTKAVITSIKSGRTWASTGCQELALMCKRASFRGKNHPKTKLSESDVLEIIDLLSSRQTTREISKIYGVNGMAISNINRGVTWSHVTPKDGRKPPYNDRYKNKRLSRSS